MSVRCIDPRSSQMQGERSTIWATPGNCYNWTQTTVIQTAMTKKLQWSLQFSAINIAKFCNNASMQKFCNDDYVFCIYWQRHCNFFATKISLQFLAITKSLQKSAMITLQFEIKWRAQVRLLCFSIASWRWQNKSSGIRTHAPVETGIWDQRLRPLGQASPLESGGAASNWLFGRETLTATPEVTCNTSGQNAASSTEARWSRGIIQAVDAKGPGFKSQRCPRSMNRCSLSSFHFFMHVFLVRRGERLPQTSPPPSPPSSQKANSGGYWQFLA